MPATVSKPRRSRPATKPSPFDALHRELHEIAVLSSVGAVIGWDQETMMPAKGAAIRAEQREIMSALAHERRTSKRLGDLIAAAEARASKGAPPAQRANLREIRRDYDRAL